MNKGWNGTSAVTIGSDVLPSDSFQTIAVEMKSNSRSNCLAGDRYNQNVNHRTGGRQLCEVVLFSSTLTDAQRTEVMTYLQNKWRVIDAASEGTLHLDVPEGSTLNNSTVSFGGRMKVVKEGTGLYVASKSGQMYTCGTTVAEGTLRMGAWGSNHPIGSSDGEVLVTTNGTNKGTLDVYGQKDMYIYDVVLGGGTLANTGAALGWGYAQLGTVRLAADSTINFANTYGFVGASYADTLLDLGGHSLSLSIGSGKFFWLSNTTITNGSVYVISGGYFQVGETSLSATLGEIHAADVDFTINAAIKLTAPLSVHDYTAVYGANTNLGYAPMKVYGTFTPAATHNYFYGCTMQDGSTIDLSGRTGSWSTTSAFTSANSSNTVCFADNATIKIRLGNRAVSQATPVVSWTTVPANLDGLTFKPADGESFVIVKKNDGLYAYRGFLLMVR